MKMFISEKLTYKKR